MYCLAERLQLHMKDFSYEKDKAHGCGPVFKRTEVCRKLSATLCSNKPRLMNEHRNLLTIRTLFLLRTPPFVCLHVCLLLLVLLILLADDTLAIHNNRTNTKIIQGLRLVSRLTLPLGIVQG